MHYPELFRVMLRNNGLTSLTHIWQKYIDDSGAMDYDRMFDLLYLTTGGYSCREMLSVDFDNLKYPNPMETFAIDDVGKNALISEAERVFDEYFDLDWLNDMCVLYFNGIHRGHIQRNLLGNPDRRSELALELFERRFNKKNAAADNTR